MKELPPRWKRCVRLVDQNLGEALGQVFVAKTFTGDVKGQALAMVKEIEKAMDADLRQLPWMGDATRKKALEKLHAMVNKIGYPDKWRDYSALRIEPDDFAGNVERAIEFESRRQLAKIGKPVDRKEWFMTPPTVDAYYNPQTNDMNFPAGVLQPPLFDPKMDDAPNYGNTGGTIGHELTHGFDDEGRQFDAKGNLKDWWTKKDADEFVKRATCISDQYSQYTVVDDVKINGKLTLGEDVADLGGLILAYNAWKNATAGEETGADRRLHAGAALLHRLRAVGLRRRAPRKQARQRHHQSAFAGRVSHQRRGQEHAGIRQGILVQGRTAHGAGRKPAGSGRTGIPGLSHRSWSGLGEKMSAQLGNFTRRSFLLAAGAAPLLRGQSLLRRQWTAKWIAVPKAPKTEYGVYHFRKTFDLARPARALRGARQRRQPVSVVRQRAARGVGSGARRSLSLAL